MSNFQPLEVADRGSETQLQVGDNLNYDMCRRCEAVHQVSGVQQNGKQMLFLQLYYRNHIT